MRSALLMLFVFAACGGYAPLVPIGPETPEVPSPPEMEVIGVTPVYYEAVLPSVEDLGPLQELDVADWPDAGGMPDASDELPGNSGNNNRCDAGQGNKFGLIKHGKCE